MTSLQKESEWEQEFDTVFAYDDEYGFYRVSEGSHVDAGEMKLFISKAIATAVANREKEIAEEVNKLEKEMPDRIDEEDVPGVTDQVIGFNKALEQVLQIIKH